MAKNQWQWLDRLLLLPRLRVRMHVCLFKRAYTRIYAVECSPEELRCVGSIGSSEIMQLARGVQEFAEVEGAIPRIVVICFGSSAELRRAPPGLRNWVSSPFGRGAWLGELRTAVALFGQGAPIRQIVVHELTHGLLDCLTGGFPYPIALAEGFARRAEYLLPDDAGRVVWQEQSARRSEAEEPYWTDGEYMSINDLLFFNVADHWRKDMTPFARMTEASFWLNAYLFRLSKKHPRVKRILAELRQKNVRSPEGVLAWLEGVTELNHAELERGFRDFCGTGSTCE